MAFQWKWSCFISVKFFSLFLQTKACQKSNFAESPRTYKYHGTGTFINDPCAINDANKCFKSFKNIYPKELELHRLLFLTLISLSKTALLCKSSLKKEINSHYYYYSEWHAFQSTYPVLYFMLCFIQTYQGLLGALFLSTLHQRHLDITTGRSFKEATLSS